MASQNLVTSSVRFLLLDIIGDVLYFPVWWYTKGLTDVATRMGQAFLDFLDELNIGILTKSLLKPMYGDYTWSGRLISFPVRLTHLCVLLVAAFVWGFILLLFLLFWILLPLFLVYNIGYQLFGWSQHLAVEFLHLFVP
jgi:hypothetical protein